MINPQPCASYICLWFEFLKMLIVFFFSNILASVPTFYFNQFDVRVCVLEAQIHKGRSAFKNS